MSTTLFSELKLSPEMVRAVAEMGFEKATRIQANSIPLLLSGKDIVGQSETGSGKTVAFAIPLIEQVNAKLRVPQGIVLCPTRELAIQVAGECARLLKHKKGVAVLAVYGGQPIERQLDALSRGVQIVIGTPGRVLDHLNRGSLKLDAVKMAVLDEADEMLDMGFRDDIAKILDSVTKKPQMAFFTATLPSDIRDMIARYMADPQVLRTESKQMTVSTISQYYFDVEFRMKTELLCRLIDIYDIQRCIIFCNQKWVVDEMVLQLRAHGYAVDGLHGDLRQQLRDRVMNAFRNGTVKLLVATDVAARGIDVENIDVVVNYDLPQDEEDYVHRIGRTGRAGKGGTAFSFVCGREMYKLRSIERFTGVRISRKLAPTSEDAREVLQAQQIEKIRQVITAGHLTHFATIVDKICGDDLKPIDVAAALLKMQTPKPKADVPNKIPSSRPAPPRESRESRAPRGPRDREQGQYAPRERFFKKKTFSERARDNDRTKRR